MTNEVSVDISTLRIESFHHDLKAHQKQHSTSHMNEMSANTQYRPYLVKSQHGHGILRYTRRSGNISDEFIRNQSSSRRKKSFDSSGDKYIGHKEEISTYSAHMSNSHRFNDERPLYCNSNSDKRHKLTSQHFNEREIAARKSHRRGSNESYHRRGSNESYHRRGINESYHRRGGSDESCTEKKSFENDEQRALVEMAPWLEHCHDPVALSNRSSGKPMNKAAGYDPMQDVKMFELEEKMNNLPKDLTSSKRRNSKKVSGGHLVCASHNMKKVCDEFNLFFKTMVEDLNIKSSKQMNTLTKLEGVLSTQKNKLPSCPTFPEDVLQIVQLLPGNNKCCDCGCVWNQTGENTIYGNPYYGVLVCKECAFRHITKGDETSFNGDTQVIPLQYGNWSLPNILSMIEGGNQALIDYIFIHENKSKKQRRASMTLVRRNGLLVSEQIELFDKRSSLPETVKEGDTFGSEFERVYGSKYVASYRKLLSDRIQWVMLKMVLNY